MSIEVGNIVRPNNGQPLTCGMSEYGGAICVSVEPFILVSEHADMRWGSKKIENFSPSGLNADELMLAKAMVRCDDRDVCELVAAIDDVADTGAVAALAIMVRSLKIQNAELNLKLSEIRNALK